MSSIRNGIVALALIFLSLEVHGAERRLLEAEEFDGLKRYPYHKEDASGWYARESNCRYYGAPGKGYHAQIHAGARDTIAKKKLSPPLPPGQYKLFARVIGHEWHDRPNVIEIGLGSAMVRIEWSELRTFTWVGGVTLDIKEHADEVTLRAGQFGGKGYRHLYDTPTRTLAVDTIYITSDLSETTGPTASGAAMIELGRDAPVELLAGKVKSEWRTVLHAETPLPPVHPRVGSVKLAAFDGRRNMWPNSSFEIGGGDGWAARNSPSFLHIFDERDHVKGGAVHGEYSRHVPAGSRGMSRLLFLDAPGKYALSLYIRGAQEGTAKVHLLRAAQLKPDSTRHDLDLQKPLLTIAVNLATSWQRVSGSADLPAGGLVLQVDSGVGCFIDALQLEPGDNPTEYWPRAKVEGGLATDAMGNILYDDNPTVLLAWAHNSSAEPTKAVLHYDIVDVREESVAKGKVEFSLSPGATARKEIVILPARRGLFSAFYAIEGRPMPEGELVYAVLPKPPAPIPRHALACNMDPLEEAHALMHAMGHKWQLYCKLRRDWPRNLHPDPNTWNWDAAREVLTLPAKYGMKTMPCLWPTRVPKHMEDESLCSLAALADGRRDVTRAVRSAKGKPATIALIPDLRHWRNYCEQIARNLGDVAPIWTIEDETENHYTPREFAGIVCATAEGFQRSGKPVRISLSCTPDFTEELIAELGGRVPFHALGGSSYSMEYWDAVKIRGLQKRLGMEWHCIGVGQDRQPQMFHSFPGYTPVYASAARTAREMVLLCLAQDAKVLGHYTGRISAPTGLYNTDFPLMDYDGSPLPHGFSYSCIPLLLPDAVPVEDVYVKSLDMLFFVYRQKGKLGAVTWANNTPNLDIHWKAWPRELKDFTLHGEVDVLDMYGNPRPDVRHTEGKTVFTLGEEPVFILNRNMSETEFIAMCRKAHAAPPPVEMRLAFIPGEKGRIDLGVWVKNNTDRMIYNPKLDANFPPNRMVTITDWILPERIGDIGDLAPGQAKFGRFATVLRPEFPVENATFTVWLTTDGVEHPWYERCWMTVAPRVTAKLDGALHEWERVQPAWLYTTFSWGRFGRAFPQIIEGAEHIKYVHRVDGRAAIFTGYDEANLYLAIRCEDDDPIFTGPQEQRDHFLLKFDIDLMGDFAPSAERSDVELLVVPEEERVRVTGAAAISGAMARTREGYVVELAVPLLLIGSSGAKPGHAIGFDFIWADADREGNEIAVSKLRWAGGSRTMGQLFFGN